MKEYLHILGPSKAPHSYCIAFDKLDGSNLRFEWSRKRGWWKFGTRHRLFDTSDIVFGEAIPIFNHKYADKLTKIIKKEYKCDVATVFCEFFGPSSFAGWHQRTDTKDLILFDAHIHKKGFVLPREFIKNFSNVEIPKVIYEGNLSKKFILDVREGKYPVTFEGVVCKGVLPNTKKEQHGLWMAKIKTKAWLDKLKNSNIDSQILKENLEEQAL